MKIFMRNIGMTLHVIHTLRAQGIDNVKVNMDWQHLIMNGENLAEYAALLAAEGLLGHQHANSGWGTFDDDNMVGATAFMETLELAIELRRAGYGDNGERLGFDLYPYTEDAVGAVKRSVLQWRFIDGVAARIDEDELRKAQQAKDAVRAYELVYAPSGRDGADRARRRHVRRQGDRDRRATAPCWPSPKRRMRSRHRSRAGRSRIRRTGGAHRRQCWRGFRRGLSACPARCTGSSSSTKRIVSSAPRSSGTTSAPAPSARRSRSGSGSSG